jgi:hypothetical protein
MKPSSSLSFLDNQNQWLFHSDFFPHTQSQWLFDSDVSNTRNRILDSEFLNYLELVVIKKNQMPTQHWVFNHISFAHLYGEF